MLLIAQSEVESFMKECGVSVDKESITLFFKQIADKNITDLVKEGEKKLIKMPAVSGGAAVASSGAAAADAAPVEEKKEEVEEVDMGGLFGAEEDDY